MSLLRRMEKKPGGYGGSRNRPAESGVRPDASAERGVQRRPVPQARDAYMDLKNRVQNRLIAEMDPAMDVSRTNDVRQTIKMMYDEILQEESIILRAASAMRSSRSLSPRFWASDRWALARR